MTIPIAIFLGNFTATWFMVGLIWFVQVAHYPQFPFIGTDHFSNFHRRHTTLTTFVVGPPMLVELACSLAMVWWRPEFVAGWMVWVGLLLVGINWVSTAAIQVPRHNVLSRGFDESTAKSLCATNWVRTIAWTAHGLILLLAVAKGIRA